MPVLSTIIGQNGAPIVGTIHAFAGSSAPSGWLVCDGSAISRSTYAALFAAIGTSFGVGDGSTTFNLPNTSGIFMRGNGSQTVSSKTFNGGSVGNKVGHTTAVNGLTAATSCTPAATLNNTNLAHTHSLTDFYGFVNFFETGDSLAGVFTNSTSTVADNTGSALGNHNHTATYSVSHSTSIGSTDTETAPAAISLNFIIKI